MSEVNWWGGDSGQAETTEEVESGDKPKTAEQDDTDKLKVNLNEDTNYFGGQF